MSGAGSTPRPSRGSAAYRGRRPVFWTAFSNVTLFLVPLVLALDHQPDANAKQAAIFAISDQMESATIGFVISVVVMGFVLSTFISRANLNRAAKGNGAV